MEPALTSQECELFADMLHADRPEIRFLAGKSYYNIRVHSERPCTTGPAGHA
jgi:hypothetical protein